MKKLLLPVIFLLLLTEVQSQSFFNDRQNRRFIASGGAGFSTYYGDLNAPKDLLDTELNFSFGLRYLINPQFSIRTELQFYRIEGTDQDRDGEYGPTERNLSFFANNKEWNVVATYDLLPKGSRYYQRPPISPYLFAGLGLTWHRAKAEYQGKSYALRKYKTEGVSYSPVSVVLPFGAGVKFKVSPYFNINLEAGYRKTFTDYLDDVSDRYADPNTITDPIGLALWDRAPEVGGTPHNGGDRRGNPENNDSYFILSVKVEYFIPANILNMNDIRRRTPGSGRPGRGFRLFGR